jgi:hypothetical protein
VTHTFRLQYTTSKYYTDVFIVDMNRNSYMSSRTLKYILYHGKKANLASLHFNTYSVGINTFFATKISPGKYQHVVRT